MNKPPPIPTKNRSPGKVAFVVIISAILLLMIFVSVRLWILVPYGIRSVSMYPTVKIGDAIWIYKLAYSSADDVKRGDLIAFNININGERSVFFKRVVGIPGDRISTSAYAFVINDTPVSQQFLRADGELSLYEEKLGEAAYVIAMDQSRVSERSHRQRDAIVIPEGCFFVLGDNRTSSADSRHTGCVKFEDIVGRKLWGMSGKGVY
ncbi:MAG: signal peptidase I [Opitutaceae bacterium]|nr:signal peptidase I [Opitutaceae bacterium]